MKRITGIHRGEILEIETDHTRRYIHVAHVTDWWTRSGDMVPVAVERPANTKVWGDVQFEKFQGREGSEQHRVQEHDRAGTLDEALDTLQEVSDQ